MRKFTVCYLHPPIIPAPCHSCESRNPQRGLVLFLLACALFLIPCTSAYAGLEVSIAGTPTANWAIGTIGMGQSTETTADKWTATGSSDAIETVYIKVDGTIWSPGSAAGADTFVLKHDAFNSWSSAITNAGNGIELASLEIAGTEGFDLQFTAPTSTTVSGEHALTVTLTAVTWDGTVTDVDGNSYTSVVIGTQRWMGENMRATSYPDGTAITDGTVLTAEWAADAAMYSCPPSADNTTSDCVAAATLGMLYQWSAAMNGSITAGAQGICPNGWHVPTDAEQHTLDDYLDTTTCDPARSGVWDCDIAGDKLKTAADCFGGVSCASSGFEGLLAGHRNTDGSFYNRGTSTNFWSSLESGTNAWNRHLNSGLSTVYRGAYTKAFGFSGRCLKD